ncbi:MAG: ATP-binding cassette domain-containing protein [Albidovulum sp.]|nr:ATP-binding cassette domain-containing protein [Albidovulum sp.]MDE0307618.1 ATP-binding cassette domain-containing protein [Albidovulum sp.]MDE0533084.1 ATP-binding cassette domain-containing protein [Albidovulum sp.]
MRKYAQGNFWNPVCGGDGSRTRAQSGRFGGGLGRSCDIGLSARTYRAGGFNNRRRSRHGGKNLKAPNKFYGDGYDAFHNLAIGIADGEFMVPAGPSGCGKTTALRIIAGLETILSGELQISGQVTNNVEPNERDIEMGFQSHAL